MNALGPNEAGPAVVILRARRAGQPAPAVWVRHCQFCGWTIVEVTGEIKKPGATGCNARANLDIASTGSGTPVSGKLNVNYSGAAGNIDVANSYIQLPNSRLQLTGSVGQVLQVHLTTRNLNDLLPALRMGSPKAELPVTLQSFSVG